MSSKSTTPSIDIVLQNIDSYPELRSRDLENWLRGAIGELAPEADSIGIRFVGLGGMRQLNEQYRDQNETTDVLSFPGERTIEGRHLGDVVICVPVARCQAEGTERPLELEIRSLLLHGVLHCLGHDHETDDGKMAALEREIRQRWLSDE